MMSNMMTSTLEVTDISTVKLDPALFDIPASYTQAASMQELYGPPSGMMGMGGACPEAACLPVRARPRTKGRAWARCTARRPRVPSSPA